jgi:comEA protein
MWKRILTLAHHAGFTRSEAAVIVFLAASLLSGAAIRALQRDEIGAPVDVRQSLSRQDSLFAAQANAQVLAPSGANESDLRAAMTAERAGASSAANTPSIVDINTAAGRTLETLPGIGPATAEKIVEHRRAHGLFSRIEDLMNVKGIGPKKFEKLRQFITVK